jgi:hypothetical protein
MIDRDLKSKRMPGEPAEVGRLANVRTMKESLRLDPA